MLGGRMVTKCETGSASRKDRKRVQPEDGISQQLSAIMMSHGTLLMWMAFVMVQVTLTAEWQSLESRSVDEMVCLHLCFVHFLCNRNDSVWGTPPRGQSAKDVVTSTFMRIAQQHNHDHLPSIFFQCSCSSDEMVHQRRSFQPP